MGDRAGTRPALRHRTRSCDAIPVPRTRPRPVAGTEQSVAPQTSCPTAAARSLASGFPSLLPKGSARSKHARSHQRTRRSSRSCVRCYALNSTVRCPRMNTGAGRPPRSSHYDPRLFISEHPQPGDRGRLRGGGHPPASLRNLTSTSVDSGACERNTLNDRQPGSMRGCVERADDDDALTLPRYSTLSRP